MESNYNSRQISLYINWNVYQDYCQVYCYWHLFPVLDAIEIYFHVFLFISLVLIRQTYVMAFNYFPNRFHWKIFSHNLLPNFCYFGYFFEHSIWLTINRFMLRYFMSISIIKGIFDVTKYFFQLNLTVWNWNDSRRTQFSLLQLSRNMFLEINDSIQTMRPEK